MAGVAEDFHLCPWPVLLKISRLFGELRRNDVKQRLGVRMDDLLPMGTRKRVGQQRDAIFQRDSLGAFDQPDYFGFGQADA